MLDGPGYFYAPAVLADVPPAARILREEVFGPVAPIATFTTEEEGVTSAARFGCARRWKLAWSV